MKIQLAALVLASACATTGRSLPTETPSRGIGPTFDGRVGASTDVASDWFPALATEASLPSTSRYQRELSTKADRFSLSVRVCVAPDGSVATTELAEGSGEEMVDRAALRDIADWRFESFTAPSHVRVCKNVALAFEPNAEQSAIAIPLVRTSGR